MKQLFSRLEKFSGNNTDELLGLSLAYIGESLQKLAEREIIRPHKISLVHYNILSSLSIESPRTASSIAPVVLGTPANFSAILTRMEKDELITRKNAPEGDRREVLVSWTEKGAEKFNTIHPLFQKFFTEKFSNISPEKKKAITQLLEELSENIT